MRPNNYNLLPSQKFTGIIRVFTETVEQFNPWINCLADLTPCLHEFHTGFWTENMCSNYSVLAAIQNIICFLFMEFI